VLDLGWKQATPDSEVELKWGYVLLGDYNQDGEVSIEDVTPIAQHCHETAEQWSGDEWRPDYYDIEAVTDGNRDLRVNYEDVDFIAHNFGIVLLDYWILGANVLDAPDPGAGFLSSHRGSFGARRDG